MSAAGAQVSYEDLYARWERGNWRALEIDLTEDRRQWHEVLTSNERRAALWNYAIFFQRFMHEVVGRGDGSVAGGLRAVEPELTWGFRKTFALLDEVTGALRSDHSRVALARAVAMYHIVVE